MPELRNPKGTSAIAVHLSAVFVKTADAKYEEVRVGDIWSCEASLRCPFRFFLNSDAYGIVILDLSIFEKKLLVSAALVGIDNNASNPKGAKTAKVRMWTNCVWKEFRVGLLQSRLGNVIDIVEEPNSDFGGEMPTFVHVCSLLSLGVFRPW